MDTEHAHKIRYRLLNWLFDEEIPQWVSQEMPVNITEDWLDSVISRIEFDLNWKIQR